MARLIDANALKAATTSFTDCDGFNPVWQRIDNAPTVTPSEIQAIMSDYLIYKSEPKRPKGEWIHKQITDDYRVYGQCSICKQRKRIDNFCPNCGADMRGEEK